jgi:hypothetical protein
VKNIGKPCAGIFNKAKAAKSHARFDEGGMVEAVMVRIVRYRRTKGAETDRSNLKPHIPSLHSTPSTLRKLLTIKLNVCKSWPYFENAFFMLLNFSGGVCSNQLQATKHPETTSIEQHPSVTRFNFKAAQENLDSRQDVTVLFNDLTQRQQPNRTIQSWGRLLTVEL